MEIHLWWIEMKWKFNIEVFKMKPFDIIGKFDPLHPQRNCVGMNYFGKGLLFSVDLEWKVNECLIGALAWTWNGFKPYGSCVWRNYYLTLPLWSW